MNSEPVNANKEGLSGGEMRDRCFGPVRFIPGQNRGKYPFCHSIYIEGAGVLIDPASDRERLIGLRQDPGVKAVWLSHYHEDHFMHLDLFDDVPLWVSEQDAPPLSDLELLMDWYGIIDEDQRQYFRRILTEDFNFRPRKPSGFLQGGDLVELGEVTVEMIHTPGHTPGSLSFFFKEPRLLFMADFDLTKFGPWYADDYSSIQEIIASVEGLRQIPAEIWLTSHETGVFEEEPGELWDQYLSVIQDREEKLIELLSTPKTMEEIVEACIVYGRPREPKALFSLGERGIMKKHLEELMRKSLVKRDGNRFHLIDT